MSAAGVETAHGSNVALLPFCSQMNGDSENGLSTGREHRTARSRLAMTGMQIRGLLEDQAGRRPFTLRISSPRLSKDGDYFCRIDMPAVATIGKDVRIVGVDAKQAEQLARGFVRKLLRQTKLFDAQGRRIRI
jgi:hypothetical protein